MTELQWSERRMQFGLYHWLYQKGQRWIVPNARDIFTTGEADILSLMKSGMANEYEIKLSRSDFKADAKKGKYEQFEKRLGGINEYIRQHLWNGQPSPYGGPMGHFYTVKIKCPNFFYYVVPKGLITIDEVPHFAGLIYVNDARCHFLQIVKPATRIHDEINPSIKTLIGIKLMHRFWNERDKSEGFWIR